MSQSQKSKFVPGHRKSRSEGGSILFACGRMGLTGSTDTVSHSGKSDDSLLSRQRHHLLDDSLLDSSAPDYHSSNEKILCSDQDPKSQNSEIHLKNTLSRLTIQSQCIFQVRKKKKLFLKKLTRGFPYFLCKKIGVLLLKKINVPFPAFFFSAEHDSTKSADKGGSAFDDEWMAKILDRIVGLFVGLLPSQDIDEEQRPKGLQNGPVQVSEH